MTDKATEQRLDRIEARLAEGEVERRAYSQQQTDILVSLEGLKIRIGYQAAGIGAGSSLITALIVLGVRALAAGG